MTQLGMQFSFDPSLSPIFQLGTHQHSCAPNTPHALKYEGSTSPLPFVEIQLSDSGDGPRCVVELAVQSYSGAWSFECAAPGASKWQVVTERTRLRPMPGRRRASFADEGLSGAAFIIMSDRSEDILDIEGCDGEHLPLEPGSWRWMEAYTEFEALPLVRLTTTAVNLSVPEAATWYYSTQRRLSSRQGVILQGPSWNIGEGGAQRP